MSLQKARIYGIFRMKFNANFLKLLSTLSVISLKQTQHVTHNTAAISQALYRAN